MNQAQLIKEFNDKYREKFNPDFFKRSSDAIIEELKKVILSCQRDKFFTIKVLKFRVVEDYKEINDILYKYEQAIINKNKTKKKDNQYEFINLKDSDIKLLVVTYYIEINGESDTLNVYIAVPRIVDKYYFHLNGNTYSASYQLVDASTYNNSTSTTSSKNQHVTFKTMFMPVRVYRVLTSLKTIDKQEVHVTHYTSRVFNKTLPAIKYILAKFGFIGAMQFLGIGTYIRIYDDQPELRDDIYVFQNREVYIEVDKYMYDNDLIIQSFVYTVYKAITKITKASDMFTFNFWLESLGAEFNNYTVEKGLSILDSLESIYDISTKESLHLPEEDKADIYCILKWIICNFGSLKAKDNLDVSTKRIRYEEYIASLYAMKLSPGIYRISDLGKRAKIEHIKKALNTSPMFLVSSIVRCNLVNYRNMVNDMDSMTALKFTYKGISGIGEQSNSVPSIYRTVDKSHIGRIDPDSSSASDPGLSGSFCPLVKTFNNSFSEFEEPNFWESEFQKTVADYRNLVGLKQAIVFEKEVLGKEIDKDHLEIIDQSIAFSKQLFKAIERIEDPNNLTGSIDLFGDGFFILNNG